MIRGSPLFLADDRQAAPVDDSVDGTALPLTYERTPVLRASARERRVIRNIEAEPREPEQGSGEALGSVPALALYTRRVTEANYTHMVTEALQAFGLNEQARVRRLHGGTANVSFVVEDKERLILTFCVEPTLERVERLTVILEHLREHGLGSNRLLRTRQGKLLQVINGVPTIVKTYLEGEVLRAVDETRAGRIGGVLSRLHELPVPLGFAADHAMNRETMSSIGVSAKDASFSGWLASALDEIPSDWGGLPVGIVHGDLFPDNLIELEGGALVPIDFEEVCLYPLVFDLGMALVGMADAKSLTLKTAASLLAGYRDVRELSAAERTAVPTMLEFAALTTACWRYELGERDGPAVGELRDWRDAQATHTLSLDWRRAGAWATLLGG